MPRLGYQKSRTGCLRCKQRRVKCDERRPCAACVRHGVSCSLVDEPESSVAKSPASPPDPYYYLTNFVTGQGQRDAGSWQTDMELIHHYTSETWRTFPRSQELERIWQVQLPKLAFGSTFLMHQLLALSASHMAYLTPDRRTALCVRASQHQNSAIQGLRQLLPNITTKNCDALFATAGMLPLYAFAASSEPANQHGRPGVESLLEVFFLIRGMNNILKSYQSSIEQGPLGPMITLGVYSSETPFLRGVKQDMNLYVEIGACSADLDQRTVAAAASGFIESIDHASHTASVPELRVLMTWPIGLSEAFVTLVKERETTALTLISRYASILEALGDDYWYLQGWGASVGEDVQNNLS